MPRKGIQVAKSVRDLYIIQRRTPPEKLSFAATASVAAEAKDGSRALNLIEGTIFRWRAVNSGDKAAAIYLQMMTEANA